MLNFNHKTEIKTSIALTTYNGAAYILQQLKSIQCQTKQPDQLVICDDRSQDDTVKIAKQFIKQTTLNCNFYVNAKQLGYSQNFSVALSHGDSDFVFLCDQDDVWLDNKIRKILETFEDNSQALIVMHDLAFCDSNLHPNGQTKLGRLGAQAFKDNGYVTGMAMAIRGDFLKLCLPIPQTVSSHDFWLSMCATALGGKVIIGDVLALYRRHDSNATIATNNINKGKKLSKMEIMWADFAAPMMNRVSKYIEDYSLLDTWLNANKDKLIEHGFTTERLHHEAIGVNQTRLADLKKRNSILLKRRFLRVLPAFSLYFSGGYRHFNGCSSCIKDLFVK